MNVRKFLVVFISILLFSSILSAQEKVYWDVVQKIREEGFERSQVTMFLSYLSDVIGPRLSGSPNMRQAQKWTKEQMDLMSLTNTAIEPWGEHGVGWESDYISIHMLEPDYQMVIGYPFAFSPGTNGKVNANAVIAVINTQADLDKYRGKLRNTIVLSTPKMPVSPRFTPDALRHTEESLSVYVQEGRDLNYGLYRRNQPGQTNFRPLEVSPPDVEAFYKREGVAVVLRASIGSDGTLITTGKPGVNTDRSVAGVQNSLTTFNIAAEHYNRMYRILDQGVPVEMEIELRVSLDESDTQEYNVLGEIRGSDLSDEVVMIGAHLDSWHTGTGANDNASGSSVVLEAMRILKAVGVQPRRTIRAALWSYEEGGLRGSRGYVRKHFGNPDDGTLPDHEKLSVYFNMDNGTGQFRGVHLQGNKLVIPIFSEWMKPFYDLRIETLSNYSNTGTDHVAFIEAGLPGFQFIQDRIDYRARTWHGNVDFFDHVLPRDLQINAVVMASFAYHAAMRDELIPRIPVK
ncbi:M20/M25/M40 family metallo-hydrolase [candidate division KSB1 bacterium]|nr:M20/M25/M40 family metallo-hydrolase [candidate division KSB1 bacterium]